MLIGSSAELVVKFSRTKHVANMVKNGWIIPE